MMDTISPQMTDLFAQLGLPSEPAAIKAFIRQHHPLDDHLRLADAPFWTDSQASFLKEKLREDGEWAIVIDSLNTQLRASPDPADLPQAEPTQPNEGEGNVTAARRYNAATQDFVASHDVTAQARAAAPSTPQEARALEAAEAVARAAGGNT